MLVLYIIIAQVPAKNQKKGHSVMKKDRMLNAIKGYERKFAGTKEGQFYPEEVLALINLATDEHGTDICAAVTLALEGGYMKGYRKGYRNGRKDGNKV